MPFGRLDQILEACEIAPMFGYPYAADHRISLCSCSSVIVGSFSQGAGGRVTLVRLKGACLSIHSLIMEFRNSSFSSETP